MLTTYPAPLLCLKFTASYGGAVQFELHAVGGQYPWLQENEHSPS